MQACEECAHFDYIMTSQRRTQMTSQTRDSMSSQTRNLVTLQKGYNSDFNNGTVFNGSKRWDYFKTGSTSKFSRSTTKRMVFTMSYFILFLHLFYLFQYTEAKAKADAYHWNTGPWSDCDCETGTRHRSVLCLHTSNKEEASVHQCKERQPKSIRRCDEDCLILDPDGLRSRRGIQYEWEKGPWGSCAGVRCGSGGIQLRPVKCVFSNTRWPTVHTSCNGMEKPIDQRPCFKVCDEHRDMYHWQAGDWEECELVESLPIEDEMEDKCGIGIHQIGSQQRNISCVSIANSSVVMEDYVCATFSPPPFMTQPCEVPCPIDCVLSHWSEWSKCSKTCGNGTQYRTRGVVTKAKYGGLECPSLSSTRPCTEQKKCDPILETYFSFILKFGNWTNCEGEQRLEIAPVGGSRRKNRKESKRKLAEVDKSLVGGRSRDITCYHDGELLGNKVTVEETCIVARDCEVSEWSEWSNCAAKCGRVGTRTRTRDAVQLPSGPGAIPCPSLEEIEECKVDSNLARTCNEYTWVTGGWDGCQTVDNATCGGGTQRRYVYCVVRNVITIFKASTAVASGGNEGLKQWAKMQPVDEEFCDEKYKPSVWQECSVPCPVMCEVGSWSDWSECAPERCHDGPSGAFIPQPLRGSRKSQKSGFKRRERKILYSLNDADGCPHTTEYIPCDDARCFRLHATSVSPCVAKSGRCGTGTQRQTVVCRDMWGRDVSKAQCRRKPSAPAVSSILNCHVPCSSDCVISEWSSWTPCTNDCKRGRRESGEQTRFREILANPGPGGRGCPSQNSLEETRPCNQHRCSIYYWKVGEWQECLVKNNVTPTPPAMSMRRSDRFMSDDGNSTEPVYFPSANGEQVCEKGYQMRDVRCWKKSSGEVMDKVCGGKRSKPLITRDCTFPCPKDCVVSEWGEWSSCEKECEKMGNQGQASAVAMYQTRKRVVVQHRTGRGTPCPIKMEEKRICLESEKCTLFRWSVSKWSECVKISRAQSIYPSITDGEEIKCLGVRTRSVQCGHYSSNSEVVPAEPRLCYKYADRSPPESTQHCLMKCKQDRTFKLWLTDNGCRATLRATESFEELYGFPSLADDDDSYITMQKTAKPVGNWSSCNITKSETLPLISLVIKKSSEPYCGVGTRERALACYIEGTDIIVDNSHCQYTHFQRERCVIPCPVDCKMSPWASWGDCGQSARIGVKNAAPFTPPCGDNVRIRHRFQLREPQHGGRTCPALDSLALEYEKELCHTVCDSLFWVPKAWRICNVYRNGDYSNCGKGIQTRPSSCYQTDRDSGYPNVARVVDDEQLCGIDIKPFGSRECNSPCRGECVYSEWSEWEKCQGPNSTLECSGTRKRTRMVMRQVANETGLPDSHCDNPSVTTEAEPCELNKNCFSYRAMWTEWSSCILPSGARCGNGIRQRRSNCISSTGLPVHKQNCMDNEVLIPEPEKEICHIICPVDCELSEWSAWTQCNDACNGIVERTRTRKIIREPSVLGRPCPVTMEIAPCPPKPCHNWKLGEWSECRIPGDNCGTGLKTRDVKCLQHDGLIVGNSLCMSEQGELDTWFRSSQLRRDCQIACAGECHLTQWTAWSKCHLRCINETTPVAGATTGVQTRSRVGFTIGQLSETNCPPEQIEERPCPLDEAKCYTYAWKTTSTFHKGKRPVWCERTLDGLNVSTGCQDKLKLQEELYCIENCDAIEHAFCGEDGICECDAGLEAKRKSSGKLISCEEPKTVNDEAKIVKVVEIPVENIPTDRSRKPEKTETTSSTSTQRTETTTEITVKKSGFFESLGLLTETGELKVWVYGAIAGIAVFIIIILASIYLICVSCRKKRSPESYGLYSTKNIKNSRINSKRHKRRNNSSGSNVGVGMVIGMGTPRFPPSTSAMSHTSSTSRSGYSYRDHDGSLWKEP